jgi:hypothetical protein
MMGVAQPAPCPCLTDFDDLVAKVEANYLGFHMDPPSDREAYATRTAAFRARAGAAEGDECFWVLQEWVGGFQDGHLFVVDGHRPSAEEASVLAAERARETRDPVAAEAWLRVNRERLDPLEGIWYDRGHRVAIIRDEPGTGRDFVAVMLTADSTTWQPGMIRAEFTRTPEGGYRVRHHTTDFALRRGPATIFKNLILRMAPQAWGRAWPVAPHEAGLLDSDNPRAPAIVGREDGTMILSIPSFDPGYRTALVALVTEHAEALAAAELLIVDIRGNEGGSSGTAAPLLPFVFTDSVRAPIGPQGSPVAISTDVTRRFFARLLEQTQGAPVWQEAMRRLEASPGQVVTLMDPFASLPPRPAEVHAGPAHVAILMDRGSVSAAEAFVLLAGRYARVTTFGQPTGGDIDYQTVMLVRLACADRGILLGIPMIGASHLLPKGGFRGRGIPADVALAAAESDPIGRIIDYFRPR